MWTLIQASDLDWTLVRTPVVRAEPVLPKVEAAGSSSVSRSARFAHFSGRR
jgi:hypothetical protein